MVIELKNLTVNFTFKLPEEDWMGVSDMVITQDVMRDVLSDLSVDGKIDWDSTEDFEEHDWDECIGNFEYGLDDIKDWCIEGAEGNFSTSDSDLQIIIFSVIYEADYPVEIDYTGENPFWLLHDICHFQYDVSHTSIYVDQYVEEERIFDGMELAHEIGMLRHVNSELIVNIKDGFRNRWG